MLLLPFLPPHLLLLLPLLLLLLRLLLLLLLLLPPLLLRPLRVGFDDGRRVRRVDAGDGEPVGVGDDSAVVARDRAPAPEEVRRVRRVRAGVRRAGVAEREGVVTAALVIGLAHGDDRGGFGREQVSEGVEILVASLLLDSLERDLHRARVEGVPVREAPQRDEDAAHEPRELDGIESLGLVVPPVDRVVLLVALAEVQNQTRRVVVDVRHGAEFLHERVEARGFLLGRVRGLLVREPLLLGELLRVHAAPLRLERGVVERGLVRPEDLPGEIQQPLERLVRHHLRAVAERLEVVRLRRGEHREEILHDLERVDLTEAREGGDARAARARRGDAGGTGPRGRGRDDGLGAGEGVASAREVRGGPRWSVGRGAARERAGARGGVAPRRREPARGGGDERERGEARAREGEGARERGASRLLLMPGPAPARSTQGLELARRGAEVGERRAAVRRRCRHRARLPRGGRAAVARGCVRAPIEVAGVLAVETRCFAGRQSSGRADRRRLQGNTQARASRHSRVCLPKNERADQSVGRKWGFSTPGLFVCFFCIPPPTRRPPPRRRRLARSSPTRGRVRARGRTSDARGLSLHTSFAAPFTRPHLRARALRGASRPGRSSSDFDPSAFPG